MAFHAIEIPGCEGFGFTGGPEFSTTISATSGGVESRNADWAVCRHKYSAPFAGITDADYRSIKEVFVICRGRSDSFLYLDPGDHSANVETIGTGDGSTKEYQLVKTASVAGTSTVYTRKITKPKSAIVSVDGVAKSPTVDMQTGLVTFSTAPGSGKTITWTGEFYVQVRFDNDYLPFSIVNRAGDAYAMNGSVDLIEVLAETEDAT